MKGYGLILLLLGTLASSLSADERLSMGEEALDHEFWVSIKDSKDPREFEEYLKVFPNGFFSGVAKIRISQFEGEVSAGTNAESSQRELESEVARLQSELEAVELTRAALKKENEALRNEMAGLVRTSVSTELALEESRREGEELTARLAETALEYKLTKEELAYLRAQDSGDGRAFTKERDQLVAAHKAEVDILKRRLSELESKYSRAVRPARSTVGRFVVEVRFWKEGDARRYSLRPASGAERSVSESELHQQLTAMKARHGKKLYTKVVPDNNSLTHGEAWRFTTKILNRYDYYYQN